MHYFIESIFVGLYCAFLYWILSAIYPISILPILLFVIGFIKHYIGYYIVHDYYCTYGDACSSFHVRQRKVSKAFILIESLLEGSVFVIVGLLLRHFMPNINGMEMFFLIGFLLHIGAEWLGIHTDFCRDMCE